MELLPLEVIANTPKIHPEYRPSCVIQLGLRLSDLHPQPVPPFWSARPLRFILGTFLVILASTSICSVLYHVMDTLLVVGMVITAFGCR
jgi:hypothetical protein